MFINNLSVLDASSDGSTDGLALQWTIVEMGAPFVATIIIHHSVHAHGNSSSDDCGSRIKLCRFDMGPETGTMHGRSFEGASDVN